MGSCVSVHQNAAAGKVLIPSPPSKQTPINGEYHHPVSVFKSQSSPTPPVTGFRDLGSKEETFFDSQAWLDSDCDDDFLSVNGDFTPSCGNTPSRGNTPNRQSSFLGTTQLNKPLYMDKPPTSSPEPSPTTKKKRLSELFQETFENEESGDQNRTNGDKTSKLDLQSKSATETPYISGTNSVCSSSEITPSRYSKPDKERLSKTIQCCLPSFVPSRRSSEKKMLSPEQNGG